jgi:DNA-directed RNA polymerase specialized sigma24 family protein
MYNYAMRSNMQNATLHIKVKPEIAEGLKKLSRKRVTSVGELVRQAVLSCYQADLLALNEKQRRAIAAYQGDYVSLGRLSEEMGLSIWEMRKWLQEHDNTRQCRISRGRCKKCLRSNGYLIRFP